jgi:hypothetical protein
MSDEPNDQEGIGPMWAYRVQRLVLACVLVFGSAVVGGAIAIVPTLLLGCTVLWRDSNLCGLIAIIVGFPIGFVLGGTAAVIAHRYWWPFLLPDDGTEAEESE